MQQFYDTKTIKWGADGKFELTVRGLCDQDIVVLMQKHRAELESAFASFTEESAMSPEFGWEIASKFPNLTALLIALAADMPNRAGDLVKIPVPVKLQILDAIYQMTIDDCGGLNNFLELLFGILRSLNVTTKNLTHSRISKKINLENTGS